jgi:hypothetical protein
MNRPRATAGADLAADLMTDLNAVPAPDSPAADRAVVPAAADRPPSSRFALQVVLRVEPLSWRLPLVRVRRNRVSMSIAAVYVEVGTPSF